MDDTGFEKKRPEENDMMMVELSLNTPTVVVWLKQAILSITLFLEYFKMTVNVHSLYQKQTIS